MQAELGTIASESVANSSYPHAERGYLQAIGSRKRFDEKLLHITTVRPGRLSTAQLMLLCGLDYTTCTCKPYLERADPGGCNKR